MSSPCTATKSSPRSPQLEKVHAQQQRPNATKNKINLFKKKKKMGLIKVFVAMSYKLPLLFLVGKVKKEPN